MADRIQFIGYFRDRWAFGVNQLIVESSLSPDEVKEAIRAVVFEELKQYREETDWEMPYSYTFGDIIDEIYPNYDLRDKLEAMGIKIIDPSDTIVELVDSDAFWIPDEDINSL